MVAAINIIDIVRARREQHEFRWVGDVFLSHRILICVFISAQIKCIN